MCGTMYLKINILHRLPRNVAVTTLQSVADLTSIKTMEVDLSMDTNVDQKI